MLREYHEERFQKVYFITHWKKTPLQCYQDDYEPCLRFLTRLLKAYSDHGFYLYKMIRIEAIRIV